MLQNQTMLKLISSMATRQILAELAGRWTDTTGIEVSLESVGGDDAAQRVRDGEAFDGVVLASSAIDALIASGQVLAASRVDLMQSSIAVAVKAGAPLPDISSEAALRQAIESAAAIGYSTGPSGTALVKLLEKWGVLNVVQPRMVQAPPGVPAGTLAARGVATLAFQQLSELMHLEGITVVGTLPAAVSITTVFTGASCAASIQSQALADLFAFMVSSSALASKQRHGMQGV